MAVGAENDVIGEHRHVESPFLRFAGRRNSITRNRWHSALTSPPRSPASPCRPRAAPLSHSCVPLELSHMIDVQNLTKYYGDYPAVRDVTFHVPKGQIVGFLGPN